MTLADMTREYIKQFAGPTMFERGSGYYRNGLHKKPELSDD